MSSLSERTSRRAAVLVGAVRLAQPHLLELDTAALSIAEAVLGGEVAAGRVDPGDALARAMALVPPGTSATARLHPADLAMLDVTAHPDLTFVADAGVAPGGCVVEAGDVV